MKLYFKDNFFNSGKTVIWSEQHETLGEVDLKSAFGSSIDVYDASGSLKHSGNFPIFSNKWNVIGPDGSEVGKLRHRIAFFSKRFEYEAYGHAVFEITSPAFSREYQVCTEDGVLVANFEKVNGWFQSDAYSLENHSDVLDDYELVVVIMGMHEMQKRENSAAHT
jgi:uncharacterized protein YxjI